MAPGAEGTLDDAFRRDEDRRRARTGFRVAEVPLELEHRATGRTLRGFWHRGRQLADIAATALDRR